MPSAEVLSWVLSGASVVLLGLIGVVYNLLRQEASLIKEEAKEQARQIDLKAGADRLVELESRMSRDMKSADERWERLFDKQDEKHIREAESIRNDFRDQLVQIREQVRSSEINILAQMKMLFSANHKND